MLRLKARDIFITPRGDIWNLANGDYEIELEDGVVVKTHKQAVIFNRYCWDMFELYPNTPITSECEVTTFLGDNYFNISTPVKLLEKIFGHICLINRVHYYQDKEPLLKRAYVISSNIYNEIVHRVSDAVTSIDALDVIELVESEEIKAIHEKLLPIPESVELAYRGIRSYVGDAKTSNVVVDAYRAKAINDNQANQCIGPRGFVTNLDRTVFKLPIMNGFIRGMGNLYELMTESRTAAKSLNATETHIRTSEYASRRIQLLTMSVTSVDNNDCRSTDYMDLYVTEKYLPNLKGKWYVINEGDKLQYIVGDEQHLIGSVIKMRTAFGCKAPDRSKICTKCLGRISENFKENSNLGYTATAFLMEMLTQSILSTKHLTHSVKKSAIKLEGAVEKYFYSTDDNEIFLHKNLDIEHLSLVLPARNLSKLTDVLSLDHTNVALNKVGELENITIRNTSKEPHFNDPVTISYKDRLSTITKHLLLHIKHSDFTVDARGNYIVPLKGFDITKPVFDNQLKETNIITFVNNIASIIEVTKNNKLELQEHFYNLTDTVYDQLSCNISLLEVIVYATTSFNAAEGNFRLGRGSPVSKQTNRSHLFRNRSMSQFFVYESQMKSILNHPVQIFSDYKRSDHPLDVLFVPQDVVK